MCDGFSASGAGAREARRSVHLDAVEQRFERRVVDLDVARALGPGSGRRKVPRSSRL